MVQQLIEESTLSAQQLSTRGRNIEPAGSIDFGKFPALARPWRPFDGERVAADRRGVDVAAHRPRMDQLCLVEEPLEV